MRPKPLTPGTQNWCIYRYLARGLKITPLQALSRFGALRLGARIFELKRRGYKVKRRMIDLPSGKTVAQYFMPRQVRARR